MKTQQPTIAVSKERGVDNAKNLFRYLAEIKGLQSPKTRDVGKYEKVIWLADTPHEDGCYCRAWSLFNKPHPQDHDDVWISVRKPNLQPPPTLPARVEPFATIDDWRDSSTEQPSLKMAIPREELISSFLPEEGLGVDTKTLRFDEHEEVFEECFRYFREAWSPWASSMRDGQTSETDPPTPPEMIRRWLQTDRLADYHLEEPPTKDEIEVDWRLDKAKRLLKEEWNRYLSEQWRPWAEADKPLQVVQETYNDLYTAYQSFQRLGEQYELVLGFGLLNWSEAQGGRVCRHVLVCNALLEFNPTEGQLDVRADPDGVKPRIELDMLEASDGPQPRERKLIERQVTEIGDAFWDRAFLQNLLLAVVNALSSDRGRSEFSLERKPIGVSDPRITLAPALILRGRSQRGYVRLLREIEGYIGKTQRIPAGFLEMIDPEAAERAKLERLNAEQRSHEEMDGAGGESSWLGTAELDSPLHDPEIYFPLRSNREQRDIAYRLDHSRGLLVQGPPGTGKTHTITNLICHLLARGSRVLITSETPRGLQGLRTKFEGAAQPLADLCVFLLSSDAASTTSLEESVRAITHRRETFTDAQSENVETQLREELLAVRTKKRQAEEALKGVREKDIYNHPRQFGNYSGTLESIAKRVASERENYTWLADERVDCGEEVLSEISGIDGELFVKALFAMDRPPDLDNRVRCIDEDLLPTPDFIEEKIDGLTAQETVVHSAKESVDLLPAGATNEAGQQAIDALNNTIRKLIHGLRELERRSLSWAMQAGRDMLTDQDRRWRELLQTTRRETDRGSAHIQEAAVTQVRGVNDDDVRELLQHAQDLKKHTECGKKLKPSLFYPKPIRESFKAVKGILVDGLPIKSTGALERLIHWLIVKDALLILHAQWEDLAPAKEKLKNLNFQLADYQDWMEPLELAENLHALMLEGVSIVARIGSIEGPLWHSVDELQRYLDALELESKVDSLNQLLKGYERLRSRAIEATRTDPEHCRAVEIALDHRNGGDYRTAIERIRSHNAAARRTNEWTESAKLIKRVVPKTFEALLNSSGSGAWPGRFKQMRNAVAWKLADQWVRCESDPALPRRLQREIHDLDAEEHRILGVLAAELAWRHCMERITEGHRQALVAWTQATGRVGTGTGKYAERHKATARTELKRCQPAIPAWVMPMHRVVESVDASAGQFDVAIIDEASQSGAEAMILNYIAKKVVVVGDDKQISPLNVGIDHEVAEELRQRFISDVRHSESYFGRNASYFSQVDLRFPNRIRLKEHFRCMPEIIQFSNNHFYADDPLIPLRQFGGGRITPVVRTEYVQGGAVIGQGTNRRNELEARRVVDLVVSYCKEPRYRHKTMGVICLTGGQQVQLLQKMLVETVGAKEIERRELLVGRPYTFQGDERDVMFLSMVNAPEGGGKCRAVTRHEKGQEFNVASSRARDQLVLVHSATLNDLRQNCLQYKLLDYCQNPKVEQDTVDGLAIDEIRKAARSDREMGSQPPPFESWFEVDVFLRIVNRGFRVTPQYQVNPFDRTYRIDMAVEGLHGRMAVECDGDYWHGPERFDEDMARQRDLERAGWTFWRVRGSDFNLDPDAAMESLWKSLREHQIYPKGEDPSSGRRLIKEGPHAEELLSKATERQPRKVERGQSQKLRKPSLSDSKKNKPSATANAAEPSARSIQEAVVRVLVNRSNNSIAVKSLAEAVSRELGLRFRGAARAKVLNRINRNIGVLKRKGTIKEYKAKNVRVKLILGS